MSSPHPALDSGSPSVTGPRLTRRRFTEVLAAAAVLPLTRAWAAAPATGAVPRLGVQTSVTNAAAVKAAGGQFIAENLFRFVQPDAPEEAFQAALEQARAAPLPILSCNYFIGRPGLRATGPDADLAAVLEYAAKAFDRASRIGVKTITFGSCGSRSLPPGFPFERGKDQFVALLERMGPLAQDHGIVVAVESLQTRECNFLTRIGEVAEVVRRARHPNIRAAADLYHMAAENDTPEDLASVVDVIVHVEIAELEGRRIPGTGRQDFRPYFRALKQGRFSGAICFEGNFELAELPAGLGSITQQWREA